MFDLDKREEHRREDSESPKRVARMRNPTPWPKAVKVTEDVEDEVQEVDEC